MATATAATGAAGIEVAFLGNAAEFESLADVLSNGLLHLLHPLLRVEETLGDGAGQKSFAGFLEIGDLGVGERQTPVRCFC